MSAQRGYRGAMHHQGSAAGAMRGMASTGGVSSIRGMNPGMAPGPQSAMMRTQG